MSNFWNAGFWNMGGYAFYVWISYALTLAVFIWNWLVPRLQRRETLRRLRKHSDAAAGENE